MTDRIHVRGWPVAVTAVAGLFMFATPAVAQEAAEKATDSELEEIVVVEAPIVRRVETRRSASGMRREVIELSRSVSYADLDLSKQADVAELERRIEMIAEQSCAQLDEMFPFAEPVRDPWSCEKKAIEDADEQLERILASTD